MVQEEELLGVNARTPRALRGAPRPSPARAMGPRMQAVARFSTWAGVLLLALGALVLLGWVGQLSVLTSLASRLPAMKANTALSLALIGLALLRRESRVRAPAALLVLLLGLLTLLEYLLHRSLGIDEWLARDHMSLAGNPPGRMAPPAALAATLLAAALLTLRTRRAWTSQALGLLAGVISLLALCGYLYGVRSLYTIGPHAAMALHTSFGMLVGCAGVLCARPGEGAMTLLTSETDTGTLVRRLLPWLVILPFVLGFLRLIGQDFALYDHRFGTALVVISSVLGLTTITWVIASSLHRSELGRQDALRVLSEREHELARQAEHLRVVAESSRAFAASTADIHQLLTLVAETLGTRIGDNCAVRLLEHGGTLRAQNTIYLPDPQRRKMALELLTREPQRAGEGISGKVAETGETVLMPHVDTAALVAQSPERFRPLVELLGVSSLLAVPLRVSGRVIGVVTLTRGPGSAPFGEDDQRLAEDLTDRAALAFENATLLCDLEQRVSLRTAALEDANRELESFSYSVSHDLRTPLRAIDGFSQALLSDYGGALDEQARHYLERIRAGALRMSTLIDDLLELARIKRAEVKKERVDLSELARGVVEELQKREPSRQVEVQIEPGLHVLGDPRLCLLALENLLGNAWKFTSRRAHARIELGRCTEQGKTCFFVRDNGAGFDMEQAHRLFTPFHRLHHRSDFEGTGVGLATVQRIVAHHGGSISAHAQLDQGATFTFSLGETP